MHESEGLMVWRVFVVSAAVIVYAGTKLSKYRIQIVDHEGYRIGRSFLHSSSAPT